MMEANEIVKINNKEVHFEREDNQIFCTSLDIARVFEKRHSHILENIYEILNVTKCSEPKIWSAKNEDNENWNKFSDFIALNFELVSYKDQQDKIRPCYKITKDGFSFIAMSLTGDKAKLWKIAFINAFNAMEAELRAIQNNSSAILEQTKEIYNLNFNTECREVVLNQIKKLEEKFGKKCLKVNYYKVEEIFENNKTKFTIDVQVTYDKHIENNSSCNCRRLK